MLFVNYLPSSAEVLDVGCGNASVLAVKAIKPNCNYTGIDVCDYHQTERSKQ